MMLADINPLGTPLLWFTLLAGGIAIALTTWRADKPVLHNQERKVGCLWSVLLAFAWAVTASLMLFCLRPITNTPYLPFDGWEFRIFASLVLGVIFGLPAGGLIALIQFAFTRHAEQLKERKAILDQAAQSLSFSPTAPRLEQSEHIRKSRAETYRKENRD
jgi:hypothetical protein